MTTFTENYNHSPTANQINVSESGYALFVKKLQFSHYAIISMAILIGSCLGGVTTMQIFENSAPMWQFVLSISITMANLVVCIGQLSTKWVVNLFAASLLVNVTLLLVNII